MSTDNTNSSERSPAVPLEKRTILIQIRSVDGMVKYDFSYRSFPILDLPIAQKLIDAEFSKAIERGATDDD